MIPVIAFECVLIFYIVLLCKVWSFTKGAQHVMVRFFYENWSMPIATECRIHWMMSLTFQCLKLNRQCNSSLTQHYHFMEWPHWGISLFCGVTQAVGPWQHFFISSQLLFHEFSCACQKWHPKNHNGISWNLTIMARGQNLTILATTLLLIKF